MTPKRRRPPSVGRYAARHPAHTLRFDLARETKIRAIAERLGVSFNQAVGRCVDGLDDEVIELIHTHGVEQGFERGAKTRGAAEQAAGYAQAKEAFCLTFKCPGCDRPIELRAEGLLAHFVREFLVGLGVAHDGCSSVAGEPPHPPDVR